MVGDQNLRRQVYQVEFTQKAEDTLKKLPSEAIKTIKIRVARLSVEPFLGKALSGEYKGSYSLRAWPYRIIYQIIKKRLVVKIVELGHRQGIYK